MANIDPALEKHFLDVSKRDWEADVHWHHEADDLGDEL